MQCSAAVRATCRGRGVDCFVLQSYPIWGLYPLLTVPIFDVGRLFFSKGSSNSSKILHGTDEGRKAIFSPFEVRKTSKSPFRAKCLNSFCHRLKVKVQSYIGAGIIIALLTISLIFLTINCYLTSAWVFRQFSFHKLSNHYSLLQPKLSGAQSLP